MRFTGVTALMAIPLAGLFATAHAWYLKPGEIYSGYYAVQSTSGTLTTDDGKTQPFPKIAWLSQFSTTSVGVMNRTEVNAAFGYVSAHEEQNRAIDVSSPSDAWLGVAYSPISESLGEIASLKVRTDFKFPLSNYPTSQHTAIGQGQNDLKFSAAASKLWYFGSFGLQGAVEPGYVFRFGEPFDQFTWRASMTLIAWQNFRVGAGLSGLQTLQGSRFGEAGWTYLNLRVWYTTVDFRLGITLWQSVYFDLLYSKTLASGNSLLFDHLGGHVGTVLSF